MTSTSPTDIYVHVPSSCWTAVLEFVDLPTRLRFATCSTRTRKIVYKDCSSLWTHIDFSSLPLDVRHRLTDKSLAELLKRVNARKVTQTLVLSMCSNVDGSGLSPIRHSPYLESVDLRRNSPDVNEERRAVRELRTMIHHKLSHVRFNEPLPTYPCGVTDFLRELCAAKLQQALEKGVVCTACGDAIAQHESRQLSPNVTGVPNLQCRDCKNYFCLGANCPATLVVCVSCAGAKCGHCDDKSAPCNACARLHCKDCAASFNNCVGCKEVSCDACRSFCATCNATFCFHCIDSEASILSCFSCNQEYCFHCRKVAMCSDCEQFLCEKCLEVKRCGYCSGYFCIDCRDVTSMPNGSGGTVSVCTKCQDKMMELL